MRILGIDFGERRIGLAVSDPQGSFALPLTTIERQTDRRAAYRIADLASQEGIGALVFGEPKGLDGHATEATQRVHRFAQRLARITDLPVHWVDEALTTVEASQRLQEAGMDRQRDPSGRRDAVAAQIILQEALDRGVIP